MEEIDHVLGEIRTEVLKARAKFPEGKNETRNDLIAYATAYMGRAAEYVVRNEREELDPSQMLIKAAGLLVVAATKE